MLIEPLKAFLFGEIQKVDIHCRCEIVGRRLHERVSADLGRVRRSACCRLATWIMLWSITRRVCCARRTRM
jgi:hypothetical protein